MSESITIQQLVKIHNREKFDCGEARLNEYIRTQASQDTKRDIAAVFVAVSSNNPLCVIGFYTLSSTHIILSELPDHMIKSLPRYPEVPAYRIGRLATDKSYQGQGIGKTLLMDALYRCSKLTVPAAAVVVDAKDQQACTFYLKYNFTQFPEQPLKLFIPMKVIKNSFVE